MFVTVWRSKRGNLPPKIFLTSSPARMFKAARTMSGSGVAGSDIRSMRGLTRCGPEAAIMPNSAMWLRIALINETRRRDRSSCVRCTTRAACCASDLMGAERTAGRVAASQIAAASAASFFCLATYGFTYDAGIILTSWPRLRISRAPATRRGASLHANKAWRELGEKSQHVFTPELLLQNRMSLCICSVNLKQPALPDQARLPSPRSWMASPLKLIARPLCTMEPEAGAIHPIKLSGIDPYRHLADVLSRLVNLWPNGRLDELLPWNWAAAQDHLQRAA